MGVFRAINSLYSVSASVLDKRLYQNRSISRFMQEYLYEKMSLLR